MATLYADEPACDPAALLQACRDASPPLPTDWFGKPNQFQNPLGRGPGRGWILLTKASLDSFDHAVDHELVFFDGRQLGGKVRTLKKITLLRARCLTPGYELDGQAQYLCELTDRRFFLAQIPINKAYNIRSASGSGFLSATLNPAGSGACSGSGSGTGSGSGSGTAAHPVQWTWQELVQDIWTILGLGTAPTLPYTFTACPENFKFFGMSAWEALNQVLDALGCTVKYDPEADTFSFLKLGDTAAAGARAAATAIGKLDRAGDKTWDAFWDEPDRGRLPEKVRVLFQRRPTPFADTGASVFYAVDVTLPAAAGVVAGTMVHVRDGLSALGTGTPSNLTTLTTRANEVADRWRAKRLYAEARQTLSYRDFHDGPKLLCETSGAVAYDDRGGVMRTEINSAPDGLMEAFEPFEQPTSLEPCCHRDIPPPATLPLYCPVGSGSGSNGGGGGGGSDTGPGCFNLWIGTDESDVTAGGGTCIWWYPCEFDPGGGTCAQQQAAIAANPDAALLCGDDSATFLSRVKAAGGTLDSITYCSTDTGVGTNPDGSCTLPATVCVSILNGTRAFAALTGASMTAAFDLTGWGPVILREGGVTISGRFVRCGTGCTLAFAGTIQSTDGDPDTPLYACGCSVTVAACAPNGPTFLQTVTVAPDGTQTIHVATACGEFDMQVGPCPPPPPPPPVDWYCITLTALHHTTGTPTCEGSFPFGPAAWPFPGGIGAFPLAVACDGAGNCCYYEYTVNSGPYATQAEAEAACP